MSISRRTAFKQALFIVGGVVFLPACMQADKSTASIALKNLKITSTEEKSLAELAETILPTTATPGSKDLYLHQFILKMIDDCQSPEEQKAFEAVLKAFEKFSEKTFDSGFNNLTPQQKAQLLQRIEAKQDVPEEVAAFYGKVKGLAIQGYLTSKHYLTNVQVYELVPGRFKGCVPVSADKSTGVRPA